MEKEVAFHQDRLPYFSFLEFQEMRKRKELCDVTLKVQKHKIVAHRVILAAGIPYFRSLFTKGADKMEDEDMGNLDASALETLINFAYSSQVTISVENVYSLLVACEFLQLNQVKEACVEFLSHRLHMYKFIEVCTLTCQINNRKLTEVCNSYIQQNAEEFSKSEDFLSLPYEYVKHVVSQDKLNISGEETVFEAIINWVKFSPLERKAMLPDLLKEVRMTNFPTEYLIKRVATEEYIRTSTACRNVVQDVQSFLLLGKRKTAFMNLNTAPGRGRQKELYAICNSALHGYSVYHCDFSNNKCQELKSDTSLKDKIVRVVACNGHIYVFLKNTIKTFHLKTLEWEVLEPTHQDIEGSTVLAHGSLIYFFGSDAKGFCDTIRCFDTSEKVWMEKGKMTHSCSKAGAALMKESIYVTGGYRFMTIFNTAEKYDPATGNWCNLPPMLSSRSHHGCATVKENIYVSGGINGLTSYFSTLNSAEVYNSVTNTWNPISPMGTRRSDFSFVSHNQKIYAIGGEPEFEIYNPEFDWWNWSIRVPDDFVTCGKRATLLNGS